MHNRGPRCDPQDRIFFIQPISNVHISMAQAVSAAYVVQIGQHGNIRSWACQA